MFVCIFTVKMGRRVCVRLKSKAQALLRHQFDCFSFKDKEDSKWA